MTAEAREADNRRIDACRIDVWLWRARICKTRALAAGLAETGRMRLIRGGLEARLDKASRLVRPGDELVFAIAGRLTAIRIEALGDRRRAPTEARALYTTLNAEPPPAALTTLAGA
jgi:ribosome-associated heat shock protein Hsp15